ncbi:uncharacterized protein BKA55DRAFT_516637 [Fusarium redolens]|uniref:Uncharacterized protein n=1 Tax=Fusarium redolens TaxID=48865 RepID=A0A9P9GTL0_FUSRE|nr:uncharacterized protein BKA55DRAFT_516637 [Fusarium redolens]KAH7244502.1 hypothetical protein BKA55DRAFT_516637 [Fusarium redolens]
MCCFGDDEPSRPATPVRTPTPNISSYTPEEKAHQDNIIRNYGWDKRGFPEKQQRRMAQTFCNEIKKAKDRGEW